MISPDYSMSKLVPPEQVDALKNEKWEEAVKMTGPKGEKKIAPRSQVDQLRSQQWAVHPDSGQLMITPDGKRTYALPSETEKFAASGHTLIEPDGNFRVRPLVGEDNVDTMARAVKVVRAMSPEEIEKGKKAEQASYTSKQGLKEEAVGVGNVGITTAATLASIMLPGPAIAGVRALGGPVLRAGLGYLGSEAGKQAMKGTATWAAKKLLGVAGETGAILGAGAIANKIFHWW